MLIQAGDARNEPRRSRDRGRPRPPPQTRTCGATVSGAPAAPEPGALVWRDAGAGTGAAGLERPDHCRRRTRRWCATVWAASLRWAARTAAQRPTVRRAEMMRCHSLSKRMAPSFAYWISSALDSAPVRSTSSITGTPMHVRWVSRARATTASSRISLRSVCPPGATTWSWSARPVDRTRALTPAEEVARRLDVPFLVVDAAQRRDGSWVIIETNDAQESGYCGVSPVALWRAIVEAEQR